jgi:hypothetical protein
MTVRQVFYRLVSGRLIAKTEGEYKATVVRLLTEMRLERELPFHWIADNTRWMRKPESYSGLGDVVDAAWATYRRALWDDQDAYVEVWCEKDALAGVLSEVTEEWDVPLMVTKGYASLSFLHSAAKAIESQAKPAHVYLLTDYDPSGLDIARQVEGRLRQFAPGAEIRFERLAVTPDQIARWSLPTRPTKRTDSRSVRFGGESVEVDAIPPDELRALVRDAIEQHVDPVAFEKTKQVEAEEREGLRRLLAMVEDERA